MGVIQSAQAILAESTPDQVDSQIAYQNSTKGKVFNSVTLDANKHYSLLFTVCDQQFTLEEWTTSLGAIATTLDLGESFDVQALFETPVSSVPSGTSVFWE
jgi:hypothetical protein